MLCMPGRWHTSGCRTSCTTWRRQSPGEGAGARARRLRPCSPAPACSTCAPSWQQGTPCSGRGGAFFQQLVAGDRRLNALAQAQLSASAPAHALQEQPFLAARVQQLEGIVADLEAQLAQAKGPRVIRQQLLSLPNPLCLLPDLGPSHSVDGVWQRLKYPAPESELLSLLSCLLQMDSDDWVRIMKPQHEPFAYL